MARRIKNSKIDTRNARIKLAASSNPYWVRIEKNAHLGYRKGKKGGYWVARMRVGTGFKMHTIGAADDTADADNVTVFDYFQAQVCARTWLLEAAKAEKGIVSENETVSEALNEYIAYLETHKKSAKFTRYYIDSQILPVLGNIRLKDLTYNQISKWHLGLAAPSVVSTKRGAPKNTEEGEKIRKGKSSANRVLTILKASLNMAYHKGKVSTDTAWRRVKPFKNVDSPKIRFLSIAESGRLVNACEAEFRTLVQAGLLTGCRYGELTKLRVRDFDVDAESIFISESKNGKPRHISLDNQGLKLFRRLALGKTNEAYFFTKADGEQWGKSHQVRRIKEACQRANISPPINFHILRHTYASLMVQRDQPLPVIAALLGHSDTRVCERHYAHLSPKYIRDAVRKRFPDLGIVEDDNIEHFQKKQ